MNGETNDVKSEATANSDFPVWYDQTGAIERFRFAIKQAGGLRVVASISGVPKGTIENILRGTDVRISAAYAIAAACHVSLDWLATGIGTETPEWYMPGPTTGSAFVPAGSPHAAPGAEPTPRPPRKQPQMNEHQELVAPPPPLDRTALAKAIEIVKKLDGIRAFEAPSVSERVANAYDVLSGAKS